MDWRSVISGTWDTEMSKNLVEAMLMDETLFEEVFEGFYTAETGQIAHRGGHLLGRVFKKQPEWLYPKIDLLFAKMTNPPCPTYRWHVLYYLSHTMYNQEYDGEAANYAFAMLNDRSNKPGVKNTALRLLEKICKRNLEIIPEFKLYLYELIDYERRTLACKAKSQILLLEKWEKKRLMN